MQEDQEIREHPHSRFDEMMKLVFFLVVDIPVILLVVGMVWLYLLSLVVRTISDHVRSLTHVR